MKTVLRLIGIVGLFAVLLVASTTVAMGACTSCSDPSGSGELIDITSKSQSAVVIGINEQVSFTVTAVDWDSCGDPYPIQDTNLSFVVQEWVGPGPDDYADVGNTVHGGSATLYYQSSSAGVKNIRVKVNDDGNCGDDGPGYWYPPIIVTPLPDPPGTPPPCTGNGDGGSEQGCDEANGGGCSSCGGGGGFPSPSLREKTVYSDLTQAAGGFGGPGADGGNSGPDGFKRNVLEALDNDGRYIRYWDESGKTNCLEFPTNTWQVNLEDGAYMTKNRSGSIWDGTFTVNSPDGSQYKFNGWYSNPAGPNQITNTKGWTFAYTRDSITGAVDSVTTPTGEVWTYGHVSGDSKITSVTAPDGTYVEAAYVQSGYGAGKLDFVKVWTDSSKTGDPLSQVTYTYNQDNKVETVIKGSRVIQYAWDTNKITVTEVGTSPQIKTEYLYGSNTTTITRKHPTDSNKDQSTVYTFYTDCGEKTYTYQVTDPLGKTTTYDTCTSGTLKGKVYRVTDALGRQTDYEYNDNAVRTLKKITYPEAGGTRYTVEYTYYGNTAWPSTVKDVRGNYTHYDRDANALWKVTAVKVSAPVGGAEPDWSSVDPVKQYEYYGQSDPNGLYGQTWKEIVPDIDGSVDQVTEYRYSESGEMRTSPTQTIYQYWNGSTYESRIDSSSYDNMGRVLSTTDTESKTITYQYDPLGRQKKTIYSTGVETENSYGCCTLLWSEDEDNRKTYYGYDDAYRLTDAWTGTQGGDQSTDKLTHYTYDAFGNRATVTTYSSSGVGRTTVYTYDKKNRTIETVYPYDVQEGDLLGSEEFGYDDVGNLWWKRDGTGAVTLYRYDALNRLTNVYYNYTGSLPPTSYPSQADVSYTYYGGSSLKQTMTDSTGTSYYSYDIQGRLTSYTPPVPSLHDAVEYAYNNLGQKTSITSGDYNVQYDYFANGWLKDVKTNSGSLTLATYSYDPSGFRSGVDYGNGAMTEIDQDNTSRHRLYEIIHRDSSWNTLVDLTYSTRDGVGNPTLVEEPGGNKSYSYDANSRLISENTTSFGYDWVGNRLNPPANPNPMAYNKVDELTSWPGNYSYDYYLDGGLHEVLNTQQQVVRHYTYHPSGLLNGATYPNGSLSNVWDADSNRVGLTINEDNYTFVYDVTAGVPAVIEEVTPTGSVYYYREPNGELIARRVGVTGTNWRYYHFDDLGSTRALTDWTGSVTDTYTYNAWGNADHTSGSTEQPYQYVGRLGYYTHYQDAGFDLLQLGVRFYDPETGRFMQRDPAFYGTNSFAYAIPNPIIYNDPTGLFPTINCPGAGQEPRVRAALQKICNNISRCNSATTGPKQQKALRDFCDHGKVQCGSRHCVANPTACGHDDGSNRPGHPGVGNPFIVICLRGFTSDCDTGTGNPEAETILHEMFHFAGSDDPGAECRMQRCIRAVLGP